MLGEFVWSTMLKPRYYDQGVDAYWLDETDGEVCGAHASTFELWNFSKVSCLSQACLGYFLDEIRF